MTRKNGPFIVIDGADGVGKTTQVALLVRALRDEGHEVAEFDFPRYEKSEAGKLLRRALRGEFEDFLRMSPYLSSWLYTLDRVAAKDEILEAMWAGRVVVSNRYTPSNIAYQAAKLQDEEKDAFVELIEKMEYEELKLPKPTLVIYLSLPEAVSHRLMEERGWRKDQHESNMAYQMKVNSVYRRLTTTRDDWCMVECAPYGMILSREEIHKMVLSLVQGVL